MSSSTSTCNTNGAPISLKFIVVGGGIGGLATAYTLKKAGHSVVVLEKKDFESISFSMSGGGLIQAMPNMTNLLYRWGLNPILNEKAHKCDRLVWINGNSGETMGTMKLNEDFLKALLTDMLLIQHGDLINILYDLAIREGVEFRAGVNIIHTDPNRVSVKLDTGEIVSGDIIVAADGYTSSLRSTMMGYPEEPPLKSDKKTLMIAFTVKTSLLKDDDSFKPVLDPTNWVLCIAEDTILQTLLMKGGEQVAGIMSCNYDGPSKEGDYEWNSTRDLESYGLDFSILEPRMQDILKLSNTVASRIFVRRSVAEDFVNDLSSIVLVGEAAHPFVPDSTQGAAMVIEDAETLGALFSRIQCREQIKQLLMAYEEIRHPRCVRAHHMHDELDAMLKQPVGPLQDATEALLRQTLVYGDWDHMDEAAFRAVWGDQLEMLAYDPRDAVDGWWGQWGSFISPNGNAQHKSVLAGLRISVSTK